MKVRELREVLKRKEARWTLSADLGDDDDVAALEAKFSLGALKAPPGAPTARAPRIRGPADAPVTVFDAGKARPLRETVAAVPAAWDWRNASGKNWITGARNQGGCGSCVAFAAIAAVEAHRRIELRNPAATADFSEAALFFSNDRQCNIGDPRYAWWVPAALDSLAVQGACGEEALPYRPVNQVAALEEGTYQTLRIRGYDSTTTAATMKRWLCEDGPLVATFAVYQDFFPFWSGSNGVYSHVTGTAVGGHAVLVVGYDDAQQCWICKNSWGTNPAHPDGCFRIAYGQGIEQRMYLPQSVYDVVTLDQIPYDPTKLRIVDEGARGWLLTDGRMRMKMFDNKVDARNGLCVARRHTAQCFVGRDNPRSNRIDYILEFWIGESGLPHLPLTKVDAIPYDPVQTRAVDANELGWRIQQGNSYLALAHDMDDSLAMLREFERHTRMCFIGRDNKRPNRKSYIMTYFE